MAFLPTPQSSPPAIPSFLAWAAPHPRKSRTPTPHHHRPACSPGSLGLPGPLPTSPKTSSGSSFCRASFSFLCRPHCQGKGSPETAGWGAWGQEELCSSVSMLPLLPPPLGKQTPGTLGLHTDPSPHPRLGLADWCPEWCCLISNPDCQK